MKLQYSILFLATILFFFSCDNGTPNLCDGSLSVSLLLNPTDCGENTGKITATANGGTAPYTFTINGGNENTTGSFTTVSAGDNLIKVVDVNNCEASADGEITTGLTYNSDIKPIIIQNCAVSGCHTIGSSTGNYTVNSVVLSRIDNIKELTASETMPPDTSGLSLTQEEIELIGCWVDDGGPE